jgi:hypothetical protein
MASPAEYGSVPADDVHVEFVSSGSTQKRWSIGKVIGAVFVVRQRVPNSIRSFWEASNITAVVACHVRRDRKRRHRLKRVPKLHAIHTRRKFVNTAPAYLPSNRI